MKTKQVVALICLIILIYVHFSGISSWLTFEYVKDQSDAVRAYVSAHHARSALWFIVLYSATVAVSLPTAFLLTLAGGYLFGTFEGALYSTLSSALGGLAAFFMMRYVLRDWVQKRYGQYLKPFNDALSVYGPYFLLVVHLMPFVPYFLINIVAAVSTIGWLMFVLITLLGVFPIALIYSFAGKELSELHSVSDIFSFNVVFALTLLAIASIVPFVFMKLYHRFNQTH